MVHHFWARLLLVKDRIKDCRDEDTISLFCKNCTNEGILNAINHHHVSHFTDLATIVQKYCGMESAWETQAASWEPPVSTKSLIRTKRMHPRRSPDPIANKLKPIAWRGTILEGWLDRPGKIHTPPDNIPTHSLRECWILRQVAKSGEDLLIKSTAKQHP